MRVLRIADIAAFRESVRLAIDGIPTISALAVVPDFGYLLVLCAGRLLSYSLHDLVPAVDPDTWTLHHDGQGRRLGDIERGVTFVRMGYCKERLLGRSFSISSSNCVRTRSAN